MVVQNRTLATWPEATNWQAEGDPALAIAQALLPVVVGPEGPECRPSPEAMMRGVLWAQSRILRWVV